jgi:two-component system, OmpR family, response regulator
MPQRRTALAGRSVVVAEDDPHLLELIVQSLREAGAAVFPAYSAEDALAICLYLKADLLITNAHTPRLKRSES